MIAVEAGWHDDPSGEAPMRWWTGTDWGPEMGRVCGRCQTIVPASARACSACGHDIDREAAAALQDAEHQTTMLIVAALIGLVVFGAVIIFVL